jgi:phosphoglucomutase
VAQKLGMPCYETPTGWKFFGNLMDAGKVTLCGEESFGTGSSHVREKDGLWAVLFWLNILAKRGSRWSRSCAAHWAASAATSIRATTTRRCPPMSRRTASWPGARRLRHAAGQPSATTGEACDDFSLYRPDRRQREHRPGPAHLFADGSRIVFRLSGTGTEGATLRVYLEAFEADPARQRGDAQLLLAELIAIADEISGLKARSGRERPTVIT